MEVRAALSSQPRAQILVREKPSPWTTGVLQAQTLRRRARAWTGLVF